MNTHLKDNENDFKDLFKPRSEEKEVKHDALILMSMFLSEIEFIQEQRHITRKGLAEKIGVKAPYLTQVFRNNKPLNFNTLAKIKRVLKIKFKITAHSEEDFFKPELPVAKFSAPISLTLDYNGGISDDEINADMITGDNFSWRKDESLKLVISE